jgi:hypothetical protein
MGIDKINLSVDIGSVALFGRRVFISYVHEDLEMAQSVGDFLNILGHRPWLAHRDIGSGALGGLAIDKGMNTSKYMVMLISKSYVERVDLALRDVNPIDISRMLQNPCSADVLRYQFNSLISKLGEGTVGREFLYGLKRGYETANDTVPYLMAINLVGENCISLMKSTKMKSLTNIQMISGDKFDPLLGVARHLNPTPVCAWLASAGLGKKFVREVAAYLDPSKLESHEHANLAPTWMALTPRIRRS